MEHEQRQNVSNQEVAEVEQPVIRINNALNRRLQKRANEIRARIERSKESQRVTQEVLNWEFTI